MVEERPIWGIHMGWAHESRPLDEGYIAIGWEAVGNLAKLSPNREAFKQAVAKAYPDGKPGAVPVNAGTLYKFAIEMKKGDLVVYPSKPDRMINLGTIEGDYTYNPSYADLEGPNRRKVKWTRHVPRSEFSQSALFEIGSAVTLFQIKNNSEEFVAAFEGKPLASADVDEQTAPAASENTQEATTDFIIKRLKSNLTSYQFEHFVAHVLERMGYHARVTQQSGDSGVDIIAHKDELGVEPPLVKVQCKQVVATIGQPEVAQLYGHVSQSEFGLFVALGNYSAQAKHFERGKHNLRLISGEELVGFILSHYDNFEPRYQMLLPLKRTYIPNLVSLEGP